MKTACLRGLEEGGIAFDSLGTRKGGKRLARYAKGTSWTPTDKTGYGRTLGDKPKPTGEQVCGWRGAILAINGVNNLFISYKNRNKIVQDFLKC